MARRASQPVAWSNGQRNRKQTKQAASKMGAWSQGLQRRRRNGRSHASVRSGAARPRGRLHGVVCLLRPTRPTVSHNFRVDQRALCSSESTIAGFWSNKIVKKGSVGWGDPIWNVLLDASKRSELIPRTSSEEKGRKCPVRKADSVEANLALIKNRNFVKIDRIFDASW